MPHRCMFPKFIRVGRFHRCKLCGLSWKQVHVNVWKRRPLFWSKIMIKYQERKIKN